MKRKIATFAFFIAVLGSAHLLVSACMCPGVNPEIYPPDVPKLKKYYRDEFKGAAFTGKVASIKEVPGELTNIGDKVLEIVVNVDVAWFGVKSPIITLYTSDNPCGLRFRQKESYFFIPVIENHRLFIGPCTYATFSSKSDGNYVELMTAMFGKGKKVLHK